MGDDVIDGEDGLLVFSCAATDAADDNAGVDAFPPPVTEDCVCDAIGEAVDGVNGVGGTNVAGVAEVPFVDEDAPAPFVDGPVNIPIAADDATLGDVALAAEFELATAAAYRIGGNAGFDPAVPGAPDDGNPAFRACDMGCAVKFGAGGNIGGGTFDESSVASAENSQHSCCKVGSAPHFVLGPLSV